MLRTIAAEMRHTLTKYSTRPIVPNTSRSRSTFKRWHSFSSLPRQSDFFSEGLTAASNYARRPYSRHKGNNEAGTGSIQPEHHRHHQQTIINNIAHHTLPSPYQPKFTNNDKLLSAFPDTTRNRILSLDRALSSLTRLGQTLPVRPENSGNLLTAFAQLSTAKRVFICVGANTAQGKTDIDSPVAAAALAHAIYKAGKVAIIVADRNNCRLVRELTEILDPEYGGFLKYIPLHAVNGALVAQMAALLDKYAPDAIIHAGVPGRTYENLYLNAVGSPINEFNIALDNLMDLGNALQTPTIAIGYGHHQAGFANCGRTEKELPSSVLCAAHQVIANKTSLGSLALGEILVAAYTDSTLCNSSQLMQLIDHARNWRDDPANGVLPVRRDQNQRGMPTGRFGTANTSDAQASKTAQSLHDWDDGLPLESVTGLKYIHQFIHERPLGWSQDIEESKLRGRTFRYICVLDSSAGGRDSAKPFQRTFRARSTEDVKILCISDDLIAPLGKKPDAVRKDFVRKIMRHAAAQGTEVIVWECNTACLEDTRKIAKEIEEDMNARGIKIQVNCVDLIDTTASAIAQYGGLKPTLLATEATASKQRYPDKIKEFASQLGKQPEVAVIGAGSSDPELEGLDWASLVNHRYHLSSDPTVLGLLKREIRRYVDRISLDTTSVWLCCTHFPALFKFIEEAMTERLKEAGITRTIPIFDPNEFQAEALIDWFRENKPVPQSDYSDVPPFSVQSTKPVIDLAAEVRQVLGENVPIKRIRLDNDLSDLAAPLLRAKGSMAKTVPPDASDNKPI
jgi:glutamate racemase